MSDTSDVVGVLDGVTPVLPAGGLTMGPNQQRTFTVRIKGLKTGTRRLTRSDLPLAALDDAGFARLIHRYPDLEDAYPVSPLQQAARLTRPVLIAHGDEDSRVPLSQSRNSCFDHTL